MFDMFRKGILSIVLFLVTFGVLHAQETSGNEPLDKSQWKELSKDLDYPSHSINDMTKEISTPSFSLSGIEYFFFALIVAALIFVIVLIVRSMGPANKTINPENLYEFDELDENLHETDLERILRNALEKGLFNLAIRVHFLIIIKALSESGEIVWKAGKTNRAYLKEMKLHRNYRSFYQLTRLYEKIWFGNEKLSEPLYAKVAPVYQQFNKGLGQDEK